MSVADLISRLQSTEAFDLKTVRDEIHREADNPCSEEDRIALIGIYNAVWDRAERSLGQQQELKNLRLSDYRLLILKEATIGRNICADTLYAVTKREIAAGRMDLDDGLQTMAAQRVNEPHPSRAEMIALAEKERQPKRRGFLSQLFGNKT